MPQKIIIVEGNKKDKPKKKKGLTWKGTALDLQGKLNMLMLYFREYDILDHYVEWLRFKAGEGTKPENLMLDKRKKHN
jgi:hypothetical protein